MQGVGYATIEIIGLILLGAVIGFLLGWILRRFLYDTDLTEYESRIDSAVNRRSICRTPCWFVANPTAFGGSASRCAKVMAASDRSGFSP